MESFDDVYIRYAVDYSAKIIMSDVSPTTKIIGTGIYLNKLFKENSQSYKKLADYAGCSRSAAINAVNELVDKGFLIKHSDLEKRKNIYYWPDELPSFEETA
jgi:biotin operon repressor